MQPTRKQQAETNAMVRKRREQLHGPDQSKWPVLMPMTKMLEYPVADDRTERRSARDVS